MNRRHFLGQVVLGSAAASLVHRPAAAQIGGGLRIKFVGMMGYVSRSDGSLLIALPGQHPVGIYTHVGFLMARAGSSIAKALGLTPMPGVVAGAFDMELADAPSDGFVFRCLDGADVDVVAAGAAVDNRASQLAQMNLIAPGKRLRGNLRRWAQANITVQGGTLENSAAHPDAGKVWSFGSYKQRITDATLHSSTAAIVRISAGARVSTFATDSKAPADLWVVSAAGPRTDVPNPKRLEHGHVMFQYFADAEPVVPTCEEAEGRITLATELPCPAGVASTIRTVSRTAPPFTDFCPGGGFCCE